MVMGGEERRVSGRVLVELSLYTFSGDWVYPLNWKSAICIKVVMTSSHQVSPFHLLHFVTVRNPEFHEHDGM